ncbi:AFL146Wp [Eremothecium gossypii ATCC 10895]|uniref:AFL146Wp n=1 Tax=Eremothecium gossypii (strain ATCC 10895 / CBS 109.51 / FGSC 9923 / NRRL Y-1056) TaxID=284811 RepID=Q755G9_EREGS|nr:AFL146Wp [Eremothecium gossypii ATCC 10895]AAS53228.1 AFL146Wp [Eremothecium gossypii ATCC 10895]
MPLHQGPLDIEDQLAIIADARIGDLDSLKQIFSELIDPKLLPSCSDPDTLCTPLHMAAANGHADVARYLLSLLEPAAARDWAAAQNATGNSALHWAALNGHLEVVKLLCDDYAADPFVRNSFGHDAIYEAESCSRDDVEAYFLQKYDIAPTQDDSAGDAAEGPADLNVAVTAGTEIEQVTRDAAEALRAQAERLDLAN